MARQRRTVTFSGNVQGVGFRYTACHLARGYSLTGYVRNMPDGSVLLVAEGADDEIDAFLAELNLQMSGYIRAAQQRTSAPMGDYTDFGVRF